MTVSLASLDRAVQALAAYVGTPAPGASDSLSAQVATLAARPPSVGTPADSGVLASLASLSDRVDAAVNAASQALQLATACQAAIAEIRGADAS